MIEFKNNKNTKGIKITERSIKSWKRDKKDGTRKYSNSLYLQEGIYSLIVKSINREVNKDSILLRDSKNKIKCFIDFNTNKISVMQYNAPLASGLRRIIIKM